MTLAERRIDATGRSASCEVVVSARDDQALTVAVRGDLDFAVQQAVRAAVMCIVVLDRPGHVVLDLSQLEFCDCAGARMLADVQRTVTERGGTFAAADAQPHVAWLMHWLHDPAS
jgi:anti-anti-sigma factor